MSYDIGASQRSYDARTEDYDDLPHTDLCERIEALTTLARQAFNRCPPRFDEGFGHIEDAKRLQDELLALRGGVH